MVSISNHLTPAKLELNNTARFSACRQYRYELWRNWRPLFPEAGYALIIGLNPSTADEFNNDPTIRRSIRFAQDWGYSGLCMANLFAYRATDPRVMLAANDPIGPQNDSRLLQLAAGAGIVVAAWGVHGKHLNRDLAVARLLSGMHCLGLTKDGHPKHPLYLRADTKPVLYTARHAA